MQWNPVELKKVHRLFYPQVPVIVTAEFEGRIGGMPAIWCMPLSFEPPLVGLAIDPAHETFKLIEGSGLFGINWMSFSDAKAFALLGEISGKEQPNKLSKAGLATIKGEKTGQPMIREASAGAECRTRGRHRTGTHELIIAEVLSAFAQKAFHDYWNFTEYNPVFYAGTLNGHKKSWLFMSGRGENVSIELGH